MNVTIYDELIKLSKSDVAILVVKDGKQIPMKLSNVPEIVKIFDLGQRLEQINTVLTDTVKKQLEANNSLASAIDLMNERVTELELEVKKLKERG